MNAVTILIMYLYIVKSIDLKRQTLPSCIVHCISITNNRMTNSTFVTWSEVGGLVGFLTFVFENGLKMFISPTKFEWIGSDVTHLN